MHGWTNFASIAKTALTNAQKKIDDVLDIREDEKNKGETAAATSVNINKLKDEFFTAFGLQSVAIATTDDEDVSSSSKTSITPTESPRMVRKSSKVKSSGSSAWSSWLSVEFDKIRTENSSEKAHLSVEDTIATSGEKTPTPFDQSLPINMNIFDSFVNSNTDIDPAFLSPTTDRPVISSNSKLALLDCNTILDSLTTLSKEEDEVASDVLCDTRISDSSDRNDVLMCLEEILQVATQNCVKIANVESQYVYHSPTFVSRRESNEQTIYVFCCPSEGDRVTMVCDNDPSPGGSHSTSRSQLQEQTQKLSGYSSPNGCNFDDMETNASSDIEVMSTPNGDNGSECSSSAIIQPKLTADDSASHYVPEQLCPQRKFDLLHGRRSSVEHNDEHKFEQLSKIIEMRERRQLDISNENVTLRIENDDLRNELKEVSQDRTSGWKSTLERDYQSISKEKSRLEQRIDFLEREMLVRVSVQQFQQVVADKDRQIKELMEEGEKLAKKELKANNVVKKLRETEVGHLKAIKSLNEKQQEMENMKKKLKEKEERELKYDSTVSELRDIIEKQEKAIDRLRRDFEDSEKKSTGYKNAMNNLNNENIELQKKIACDEKEIETLKSTIDETRNADLAEKFETAELEKESVLASCRKEIDALKNHLDNCQKQHGLTEQSLKNDAKRLELKVQEMELRDHQLIDNTTCATRPLVQQIESLQTSIRNQEAQFERVEKALFEKLVQAEKDCAVWKEKEQNSRTFIEEYKHNIYKQDNEASLLRNEIKRLKQDFSKSEDQVSTLKEAKEKFHAELQKETLLRIRYTEDIQKEKEILISQFEFEKNHFKSVLDQSMRDLQANLSEKEKLVKSLQEELTDYRMKQQSGMRHESSLSNRLSESSTFDTVDDVYELPHGSYATVLEHLRAKLQEKERDLWICKEERKSLQISRDSLMASLTLITEEKDKMEEYIKLHEDDEQEFKALKKSYDTLLQMYGEKVEENEELRLDLVDVKVLYKQHIEEFVSSKKGDRIELEVEKH